MARDVIAANQYLTGTGECDRGVSATEDDLSIGREFESLAVFLDRELSGHLRPGSDNRSDQDGLGGIGLFEKEGDLSTDVFTAKYDCGPSDYRSVLRISREVD